MNPSSIQSFEQLGQFRTGLEPNSISPIPSALSIPSITDGTLLSTNDVAKILGLSPQSVRLRTRDGRLHPIKVLGDLRFNPIEISEEAARMDAARIQFRRSDYFKNTPLPPIRSVGRPSKHKPKSVSPSASSPSVEDSELVPYTGEQAARSVELFLEGKGELDIICEMKITYDVAKALWKAYQAAQSGWHMPSKLLARVRYLLEWEEETPTSEGFEKALNAHIEHKLQQKLKAVPQDLSDEDRAALAELDRELAERKPKAPTPVPAAATPEVQK